MFKIELLLFQDYIQMYLGELSPIQESRLVQLKSWVSNLLKVRNGSS
jgi:hypothetical protein